MDKGVALVNFQHGDRRRPATETAIPVKIEGAMYDRLEDTGTESGGDAGAIRQLRGARWHRRGAWLPNTDTGRHNNTEVRKTRFTYGIAVQLIFELMKREALSEEECRSLEHVARCDAKRWRDASELPISAARDEMAALAEAAETLVKALAGKLQ